MKPRVLFVVLALGSAYVNDARAADVAETTMFEVAAPSGWLLWHDQVTLVVAQPKTAELVYFDTLAEEELRRVTLDFAPGKMVAQGDDFFVAVDGGGLVYQLDFESGEVRKEYTVPGNGITDLACHPEDGPIYAATSTYEVFAIDSKSRRVTKTEAVGNRVKVDPVEGRAVYTGVLRNDVTDVFLIKVGRRGGIRIIYDRWGPRSGILKYRTAGRRLRFDGVQENATVNAYQLYMTPDGKHIMMTGGGGWRPPADSPGTGGGYYTAVFATSNLKTMVGKAPHAMNVAFHPKLRLAVGNHSGRDLHLFDPRSFAEKETIHLADGADMRPLLLTFVGKGTKIAVWNGDNSENPREGLHFLPLALSDSDRELLIEAYGELPSQPAVAARTPGDTGKPGSGKPMPRSEPITGLDKDVIALAGFNDSDGFAKSKRADAPYPLGTSNQRGGLREPGWSGPWPALDKANYQREVTYEGDGALWLEGTANYAREFAQPLTGIVEIEQQVQVPAGSNLTCYVWQTKYTETGPMWRVRDGQFNALNGDEGGGGEDVETGIACEEGRWYRVVVTIDVSARRWRLSLPDLDYTTSELRYRARPKTLKQLNYLTEHPDGVYIDAIQIRRTGQSERTPDGQE